MTAEDPVLSALASRLDEERAVALLTKLSNYANLPAAITGTAKTARDDELESAALAVLHLPEVKAELGLDPDHEDYELGTDQRTWGLLTLAARADLDVLAIVPADEAERWADRMAAVRRAAVRAATDSPSVKA